MVARRALPLAVAFAVHAAILGAIAAMKLPAPPAPVPPEGASEIDLEAAELATVTEPGPETIAIPGTAGGHGATGAKTRAAEAESPKPLADGTGAESPADPGWSFSPFAMPLDPRAALTPDVVRDHGYDEPPDATGPARPVHVTRSTTGGLAEGLAAHDVAIGMSRGGAALAAVEDAARSNDAPSDGHATFEIVVGREGKVEARVLAAGADLPGWERVAAEAARGLDPRRVRLPSGARGWRVVVDVEAKVELADGRDVKSLHGARTSVAPSVLTKAIEGTSDDRGSSTGPGGPDHVGGDPTDLPPVGVLGSGSPNGVGAAVLTSLAARVLPTPTLDASGRVCSGALAVSPTGLSLSGSCSLENLVIRKTSRVVSGRIASEAPL